MTRRSPSATAAAARDESVAARLLPYLIVSIAPLCWAGNIVLGRGVIHLIPPVSLAFWRWAIAFLILLPFTWTHAKRDWPLVVQNWRIMLVLSIFGISCFNTLLYTAVHTITAINGALIQTTMPAFIIVIMLTMFNEKVTRRQLFGVALCILGAGLVVLRGRIETLLTLSFAQGDLLMIIAVILYAFYTALLRRRPAIHPLSFLTFSFGIGVMGLLPLYVWERARLPAFPVTAPVVFSVLYVAIFPSIVAYLCWNRGAEMIGPNRTGLFINLIPVFASILAIAWLGESLRMYHGVGMGLILTGMALFNRG